MRAAVIVVCFLIIICLAWPSDVAPAQEAKPTREKFSALAYMPTGAGRAMVGAGARLNVDLYINSYTSDEEAQVLADFLMGVRKL